MRTLHFEETGDTGRRGAPDHAEATVRPARPEEAEALSALARATFPDASPDHLSAADLRGFMDVHLSVEAFHGYLAEDRYTVLVAEDAGAEGTAPGLIGYTLLDGDPDEHLPADAAERAGVGAGETVAYLSKMYVSAAARGTGAATALMTAALRDAAERGHHHAWLGVNQLNARANAFYERLGFRLVGERTFTVGSVVEDDFLRAVRL